MAQIREDHGNSSRGVGNALTVRGRLATDNNIREATMLRLLTVACAAVLGYSGAVAEEIHVSHFGQVMLSVPWILALEQDLFRKNGVDVTDVITSQGGGTTLRNMLAGGIPFADAAIGATVTGFAAGLPIKIIGATSSNAADNDWVVPADSRVKSLRDVVGGKFGTTTPGGLTRVYGDMLLRHNGIDPSQVTQVPLGVGAAVAALNSGAVDTAYMYEPLQSKFGSKYRAIARVSDVLPHVISNVLVASQEFIDRQPDKLRAIMLAHKQAVDFVYAHPKEAAQQSLERMVNIDPASLEHALDRMVKAKYYSDGGIDPEGLAGSRKLLMATGEIDEGYDFETIIDRRFIPK
jgi:NitT/TauT family transport system substrate-binding protein